MVRKRRGTRAYLSAEDRRAEIVEAAFKCLQEFGYAKLTARKIAETSGISLGHITYNFKDMNEVLVETYRYASRTLYEATMENLGKAPETSMARLRAFLRAGFTPSILKKDYIRVRVDLWSAALSHEEISNTELVLYQRYREHLALILSTIAAERGRSVDEVPLLTDTIMATLDGLWLDWERRQSQEAVDNGLEGCIRLVEAVLPA
ncbi:TetR family transcriptional regulator [Nordella sp. HKS 07]|uniref:TetR/AcrR family transcriptional regulator n=1 Tax=Nordella sp. HKS 07 TaxID=2712222 RepID=UPI0013E1633B|nr:TetR/AcrR family transcriptional regulator [Nordella sp. HKS 07]QIG46520.1 TetR family transcriptional regulator [Nordella sp. HKS 07]